MFPTSLPCIWPPCIFAALHFQVYHSFGLTSYCFTFQNADYIEDSAATDI